MKFFNRIKFILGDEYQIHMTFLNRLFVVVQNYVSSLSRDMLCTR